MQHDLTIETGVKAFLEESTSASDWDNRCDQVKKTNRGYPPFWYKLVIMGGLANKVAAKWGGDGEIHITTLG